MGNTLIYVVDNNVFSRTFCNFSMSVFDDIWEPWSSMIHQGKIISVDEVLCELNQRWDALSDEGRWLKSHKECFLKTTNEEGFVVAEIFRNRKFREGVKEASLRNGSPEADAFLVAKAKVVGGVIVTAESDQKPRSEKIPNIAVAFKVPYMTQNEFYRMLRNIHGGRSEHEGVSVCYDLGLPVELSENY